MNRREIENLQEQSKFLKRLKIYKIREELEFKCIEAWWDVIWSDIMTEGERKLFLEFPDDFLSDYGYIRFLEGKAVTSYSSPDLPPPFTWPAENWIFSIDGFYYHQGERYITYIPGSSISFNRFWLRPNRIERNGSTDILNYRLYFYKLSKEKPRWFIPKICYEAPGIDFLTKGIITSNNKKKTLHLHNNERTEILRETLLQYIKAYRIEVSQRLKLWDFLTSPGVGIKGVKKLWPELFI